MRAVGMASPSELHGSAKAQQGSTAASKKRAATLDVRRKEDEEEALLAQSATSAQGVGISDIQSFVSADLLRVQKAGLIGQGLDEAVESAVSYVPYLLGEPH